MGENYHITSLKGVSVKAEMSHRYIGLLTNLQKYSIMLYSYWNFVLYLYKFLFIYNIYVCNAKIRICKDLTKPSQSQSYFKVPSIA